MLLNLLARAKASVKEQPSLQLQVDHSMTMGAPRALMGLCRGPTLDTQLLKAAVAAEQGLPLHNSVGLTALHCLCENEAVTAAALEAVLPCGPRDLALARDRCATSPLDLLCRNGAVSVAMLEVNTKDYIYEGGGGEAPLRSSIRCEMFPSASPVRWPVRGSV